MNFYSSYEDYDNTTFKQITQSLWLWVLIFSLGFIIPVQYNNHSYFSIDNVIYLSIIGFVLYVMIFEARARYLFVFAPIFIVCAFIGFERIYHYLLQFSPWSIEKH
jgi:membrane protein YdbS with pleckstrin-like domain